MIIKSIAPAKINLALNIKSKRKDGYHEVDMIMQTISICDSITVENIDESQKIKIECDKLNECDEKNNIAYKAAELFFDYVNIKNKGILIKINKKIPICAGLAGGSSDGAAVILSLDKMFNTNLKLEEISKIGAKVGADVPFCILGGTMRACGIGDKLEKLKDMPYCSIIVVKPNCDVLTKEAYGYYDKYNINFDRDISSIMKFISSGSLNNIAKNLFNDFEELISKDEINIVKNDMLKYNPLGICMSGSGPSVFSIFEDEKSAKNCFKEIKKKYKESFICNPLDHGAKIIEIH